MRLPGFCTKLSPIRETLDAIDAGQTRLEEETASRNRQLAVSTADDALDLWERDYSLPEEGGGTTESRRARVLAAMAGGQTLTKARLEALAVAVGGADRGEAEEDFAHWRVVLTAVYEGRVPADTAALEEAIQRQKPAHLEVVVAPTADLQGQTGRYLALTGGMFVKLRSREGA